MKIAFFEIKEDWEKRKLISEFPDAFFFDEKIQEIQIPILKQFDIISVFIHSRLDSKLLEQLPKLKCVATRSTGIDHIDCAYCDAHFINVYSIPNYGSITIAEFTFALMLSISRKIPQSISRIKAGIFDLSNLQGFDLCNKTIGLLGFGKIGQQFAKMCVAFNMNVLVFDIQAQQLRHLEQEIGVTFVSLDELYKQSEILSLHIPLLNSTKHIINSKSIAKMKEGVIILNTSRGGLINTKDVYTELVTKKIAFLGLDVLENEHEIKRNKLNSVDDNLLISHPHCFVTPHNAFNSIGACKKIINSTVENINSFLNSLHK